MALYGGHASGTAVVVVTLVFTAMAIVASLLRVYTRTVIGRNGGYDDGFIICATILSIALTVCTVLEIHYGDGRHQWTITPPELTKSLKTLYASIIIYQLALSSVKASIILQYLRIFPQRSFRLACWALMAMVFAYLNWTLWSQVFFCKPIKAYWDPTITDGKCFNRGVIWFVNAGVNILTDIAVAVLPLPMLRKLNTQRRPKIALLVVFALGGFTCIVSILRLESLYAASHSSDDASYNSSFAALWSSTEVNIGILCSCLPTLKTLVSKLFPRLFTSYHRSRPSAGLDSRATFGSRKKSRITHGEVSRSRGLGDRARPSQHAFASRGSCGSAEIDLAEMMGSPHEIKVVTVLNQEVEKGPRIEDGAKSESESTRDLIHRLSFSE
ncbi:hypothetical protein LTR53_016044 [Teratosphaeriaceae sp. CCFEE 6253]|nr:hypothetical protein LTR53_016044 [Teratosphaeriaceae sp. CCFEE 6253]